jgi:glycosyltransferase involved in cell wall biosynthesis
MKIASFAFRSYPSRGGVEYHQKLISEYLAKKGNHVTVFTSRVDSLQEFLNIDLKFPFIHRATEKSTLRHTETIKGVKYKRFDIRFRLYSYNQMPGLYAEFDKDIKDYDIVHLHGLNVYNSYRLAKIAYRHNIPVILSCYDISIPDNLPIATKIFKKIYDKVFIRRMNRYVSEFLLLTKDQTPELAGIGIDRGKIDVWSAGFDVRKYRKKISPIAVLKKYGLKSKGYAFNMGRIEEYKGIQDIIEIADNFPKIKFVIAGKDQGYLESLKKMVFKKNLKNVIFLGEIDDKDSTVLLQNASAFLFPSKKEGWGIVLAEAMSVGIPCIAYNIPNVRTVFTDKKSGFYVKNVKEIKQALTMILEDKKMHLTMSRHAYIEAEKYDYRNTLPILEKKYRNIVEHEHNTA